MYKVIGISVIVVAAFALLYALYLLLRGMKSLSWPRAEATIQRVSLTHAGTFHQDDNDRTVSEERIERYLPDVRYHYVVGGRAYEGGAIVIGGFSSMAHEDALAVVRPYRDGMKVPVRYDPDNPASSVLKAGANWSEVVKWGLGSLVVLAIALFTRAEWWHAA